MGLMYTVESLVDEIRQQLDEDNTDSIDTNADILPALNRAQKYAFDILARKYPEPLLRYTTLTLTANVAEYPIPEDVFEDRIQKLEVAMPSGSLSQYSEVERRSYRDITSLESTTNAASPRFYVIFGRTIRLIPAPSGAYNIRMWSLRNPEKLVLPQGRITVVNTTDNYVTVDSAGDSLTTETDQLGSYVNFIDGQTGEIKGSAQIRILSGGRITFRTSPLRSTVLGRTISSSLTSLGLEVDDYIAPIQGTCVPYFSEPVSNFLIEYSVAALKGKLEGDSNSLQSLLESLEKQVERTWVGREQQLRVKRKSNSWNRSLRLFRRWSP